MKTMNFNSSMTSLLTSLCGHRALWLLVFITALATSAKAQYELSIGTETSYETSVDNIESKYLKSGKVSFDATQGVVTLENVVFENPQTGVDGNFISFSYPGVTGRPAKIILKGENKITCGGNRPIDLTMLNCTIIRETASGYTSKNCVLEVNCTNSLATAIRLNKSSLLISNCTVKALGGYYGIGGNGYDVTQMLSTFQSNTVAKGSKGSIANIYTLTVGTGTSIRRPAGAAFDSSLHGVALGGSLVTDEVLICESDYTDDDTAPKPGNMNITTYASLGRAYVTWEPATDNKTAQADLEYRLSYKKKGDDSEWITAINWQKNVKAYNITGLQQDAWYYISLDVRDEAGNIGYYSWTSFRVPVFYGFWVEGSEVNDGNYTDIPITSGKASYDPSNKTLTLTNANIVGYGNEEYGIYNRELSYLTIKPVGTNHITTDDYGLRIDCNTYINGSEGGTLTIESNYMKAVRGDDNAELYFNRSHIEEPLFGTYDKTKGRVLDWNGNETKIATFAPEVAYDLYLTTRVTVANKDDIKSTDIKSGKASYDSVTRTLTLDNVNIVSNDDCIISKIDGLTVNLVGENKLFTGRGETIWLLASATFTGDGKLTVEVDDGDGVFIGNNDVTMTIDHTTMRIASNYNSSAIFGSSSYSNKKVVINRSGVTLYSAGTGDTVTGLDAFELIQCAFESADYYFDASKGAICDKSIGGYPAGQSDIVIVPVGETGDNVAYAEYTDADKTLTFYYDKQKDLRTGSVCTSYEDWSDYDGQVTKVVFDPSFVAYQPTSTAYWFAGFKKLETVENLNCLTTSKVTDMSHMFEGCKKLTSLDLSLMNTSAVTDMSSMFADCSSLTSLELTSFDTRNVTNMGAMFDGCSSLTMLGVNLLDTRSVTDMSYMFSGCSSLTNIEIGNFKTSAVTSMYYMFANCKELTDIDLLGFDMGKVTSVGGFFYNCEKLNRISCNKDWSKLTTLNPAWSDNVFKNCYMLTGGNGTVYDAAHIDVSYARPDLAPDAPGYFTRVLQKGDVNADYSIDVADIAAVISFMAGKKGVTKARADVNGDGDVDVADIATVISIMAAQARQQMMEMGE